jgi:hypothetical protein
MLAVNAPIDRLAALADQIPDLVLANRNSPDQGCFPGPPKPLNWPRRDVQKRDTGPSACRLPPPFTPRWWKGPKAIFAGCRQGRLHPHPNSGICQCHGRALPDRPSTMRRFAGPAADFTGPGFKKRSSTSTKPACAHSSRWDPKPCFADWFAPPSNASDVTIIALDRSAGKASGMMDLAHTIGHLAALGVDGRPEPLGNRSPGHPAAENDHPAIRNQLPGAPSNAPDTDNSTNRTRRQPADRKRACRFI